MSLLYKIGWVCAVIIANIIIVPVFFMIWLLVMVFEFLDSIVNTLWRNRLT